MKIKKLKELVLILVAIILVVFLIKYLNIFKYLGIILTVLIPLFIGFIYAWIFNPLIVKLSKKVNRNVVCILLFLVFVFLFSMFIYYLVPMFYKEVMEFIKLLPGLLSKIEIKVESIGLRDMLDKLILFVMNSLPDYFISFVKGTFKYVGVIVIGLILGLYISFDYEKIVSNIYSIVPKKYKCVVINLSQDVSSSVRRCVNGTLLVASFVFILDSICFLVIGLENSLLLGMICGLTDLIPYVGPYMGGMVAVLVGFTESKRLGILCLIVCLVVQVIESYVLQPVVMSKSIKISPVLIIVGLLVFGKFFGVFGMVLATPILAMVKVVVTHLGPVLRKCGKKRT
jgi:predicted PurR-regulated permease PerM